MLTTLLATCALLLGFAAHSHAGHFTCSWTPSMQGWTHFCGADAVMTNAINTSFAWHCKQRSVATYEMQSHALTFKNACGERGWAANDGIYCASSAAICLPGKTCYAMKAEDECTYPDLMNPNELPNTVEIWLA